MKKLIVILVMVLACIVVDTKANCNITGTVTNSNGNTIYGAKVEFYFNTATQEWIYISMTNGFGYYVMYLLEPYEYVAFATHRLYTFTDARIVNLVTCEGTTTVNFQASPQQEAEYYHKYFSVRQ